MQLDLSEGGITQAGAGRGASGGELAGARSALLQAEARSDLASADFEHHRNLTGRELLGDRHRAVLEALAKRRDADGFLRACRIDRHVLDAIETANLAVATARATMDANRATVTIEALRDQDVSVAGTARRVSVGERISEA